MLQCILCEQNVHPHRNMWRRHVHDRDIMKIMRQLIMPQWHIVCICTYIFALKLAFYLNVYCYRPVSISSNPYISPRFFSQVCMLYLAWLCLWILLTFICNWYPWNSWWASKMPAIEFGKIKILFFMCFFWIRLDGIGYFYQHKYTQVTMNWTCINYHMFLITVLFNIE